jgi:hypothetical protein
MPAGRSGNDRHVSGGTSNGFLFQHRAEFAADVDTFLTEPQR